MAILRHIYLLFLLLIFITGLTSCYQTFEPDLESDPVLCMNSEITPGDPIILYLTRTWNWTENNKKDFDIDVTDAKVSLYVNGEFKQFLTPGEINNGYNPASPYPEVRRCYQSDYTPKSGDVISLEASSPKYGEARVCVTVPEPVNIDHIDINNLEVLCYDDQTGFPAVAEFCSYYISFNSLIYFSDPVQTDNYYDVKVKLQPYQNYDELATSYGDIYPDFDNEPLFTEHVSSLEAALVETSGYTIFSDRQINGKTYPLKIGFPNCTYNYWNPSDLEEPQKYGIVISIRNVDDAYYKHVLSLWEANDAIVGSLGNIGLASQVYPYSNVSTGAGVVTAYASSEATIPFVQLISMADSNKLLTLHPE